MQKKKTPQQNQRMREVPEEREMENTNNPEILAAEISAIRHDSPQALRELIHYTAQLAIAVQVMQQTARSGGESPAPRGKYGVQPTCPYCEQSDFGSDRAAVYHCLCNKCGQRFFANSLTGETSK